jgi:hypothetical protein
MLGPSGIDALRSGKVLVVRAVGARALFEQRRVVAAVVVDDVVVVPGHDERVRSMRRAQGGIGLVEGVAQPVLLERPRLCGELGRQVGPPRPLPFSMPYS